MPLRHTCVYCKAKRYASAMSLISHPLIPGTHWICRLHVSASGDILEVRDSQQKPVFVELFSGSGDMSAAARCAGFDTITIDIDPANKPDICIDIMNLRRSALPGCVDVIWASVPCETYSVLSISAHWEKINLGYRNYWYTPRTPAASTALRLLTSTIRLITRLNPRLYFIENPRGALRHIPQLAFVPYRRSVAYSDYGTPYNKPTDIFTNCKAFKPKELTRSAGKKFEYFLTDVEGRLNRAKIPPALIAEVIAACKK